MICFDGRVGGLFLGWDAICKFTRVVILLGFDVNG